ncbi:pseudouridylate synthase [Syntrophotalea acetylenivorans]|uniref:tRNA pseudouridine synthase C n=1 Tax=Syntrophotalea acetylenivorans TaxID=1842532 RepID=A0A1L3GR00_9BACT|nr:tRNA pseudouridine(65) synthase TruC [Syntrophotalea acetylenivorans]APG28381.1 pseudouridylate synthase [Syntrophotalea acetylenivorans]
MDEALEILYRDEHLVAVNKPAGLLVHRSPIDRRETRFALQIVRNQLGKRVYPVHRLDKPTSGVLLFGLSSEAAHRTAEAFAGRQVSKKYLAVLRGYSAEQGTIDYPLRDEPDQRASKAPPVEARPSRTDFRRLATVELPIPVGRYPSSRYSLVEAQPLSGRRHQLRRHFKHLSHPIVGDTTHGNGDHNRFFRQQFDCHRLLLAAIELSFAHPYSGLPLTVQAPLADDFCSLLTSLGWNNVLPGAWLPAKE